ncbi:hypothetical protein BX666DRAFT_1962357 [Dichotomocladium elegans]|nr:hypothetical protein BX666DRAFT_1962357 [Dichotomocladium elegans]
MSTLSRLLLDNLEEKDIIATALPRIVSTLCRIVDQKKEKENHRIIVAALTLLGDVIVAVLQDRETPDYIIPNVTTFKDFAHVGIAKRQTSEDSREEEDGRARTRTWYTTTKDRIKENLDRILMAQSHQEWRARLAFVRLASKLLIHCVRTLDNCVPNLLKTLILHIDDEYREVANECKLELQIIMNSQSLDQLLIPTLKTSLYAALAGLPGCLISGDECEKDQAMVLITGYVLVLGRQAENVLNTAISRHSDAWIVALEIDENGMNVLEETQQSSNKYASDLHDDGISPVVVYPRIRFKHFVSDRTADHATRMFNIIGRNCDLNYWINHFKGCFQQEDWKPQAAYVIHSLLSGANSAETANDDWWKAKPESDDDELSKEHLKAVALQTLHDIVELVIDPVSESESTNRALVPGGRADAAFSSPKMETPQVLSVCFSLQTIGLIAVILERKYMQDELITLLYPLLAHLGSPNIYIHSYALITLDVIALICGLQSAKQLALENTDYVINMVTQRMTTLADNLQGPLVLKAMIRIGGLPMVDYLGDTVEEIFDALDRFHMNDWMCAQLCSVLTEILLVHHQKYALLSDSEYVEISQKTAGDGEKRDVAAAEDNHVSKEIEEFIAKRRQRQEEEEEPKEAATADEIRRYFMDRQEQKDQPEGTQEPGSTDETPEPLTKAQQMTMDIMQKAYHFLTAPSPYLRTEILGLLGMGAIVMKDRPEKLAPLVATIWPSIMSRLSEKDANHTVIQAIVCVGRLAECLDDYMSRKFVDDAWPKLKMRLRLQNGGDGGNAHYYSPFSYEFKLHCAILRTIKTCIDHVHLPAAKVPEIAESTKRFLSERLHPDLQESAIGVFQALGRRQADVVWLCLVSLLGDRAYVKEDERVFVVPEWMRSNDKYLVRNARRLLSEIGS